MMPTDDKLKQELAHGPLKQSGFDERLRRRIEERLDESPSRRPFRPYRLAGAGLALSVMIVAAVLLVRLHPMSTEELQQAAEASEPEAAADKAAIADDAEAAHRRSVLLLGLRQDGAEGEASAYRTLLVAGGPEPSDWQTAEGEGLVMPYRIDFWRLDVRQWQFDGWGGPVRLAGAWNASRGGEMPPPSPVPADGGSAGPVEERILFAGNRYIAIARRTGGEWTQRMTEVADLAQPRNLAAILSGTERAVPLEIGENGMLGVAGSDSPGFSSAGEWNFARRAGLWTALGRGGAGGTAERPEAGYVFDASLVAHNELALSWRDIREVQPAAVDAVTSPIRNMAGILTDRKAVFYSMKGGELDREMLELPLRPDETVVMAEWATHVDYVDEWVRRVTDLFEQDRTSGG